MSRLILFIALCISLSGCIGQNTKSDKNYCNCTDALFTENDSIPILEYILGSTKVIVCGYKHNFLEGIEVGKQLSNGNLYGNGYEVFVCKDSGVNRVYSRGEYYLELISPLEDTLKITRLTMIPQPTSLMSDWTPMIAFRLFEQDQMIKMDTLFVFPIEKYSQDFIMHHGDEVNRLKKEDGAGLYKEHLIGYAFIKAVKEPEHYSKLLKTLGPFDGYLGPIYRDMLWYFDIFYKNHAPDN
jgi:hypothetical protein